MSSDELKKQKICPLSQNFCNKEQCAFWNVKECAIVTIANKPTLVFEEQINPSNN